MPPDYKSMYAQGAVTDLDTLQLEDQNGDGTYTASYTQFLKQGTYKITCHAQDARGYLALPKVTRIIQTSGEPVCDIKVNNKDHTISLKPSEKARITLSLSSGIRKDQMSDWWVVASTPSGWKSLTIEPQVRWVDGIQRTLVMPLIDLPSIELLPPPHDQRTKHDILCRR